MNVTLYVVRRNEPAHDNLPPAWDHLWLVAHCNPGDAVVGRIDLEGGPVDGIGPVRLRVVDVAGLGSYPALAGKLVLPMDSARCVALVLGAHEGIPVVVEQRKGDGLWAAVLQRTQIGYGWRPVEEVEREIEKARPDVERIGARKGRTLGKILEARWAAYVLSGGGTQTALVRWAGDDTVYVVEWGGSEDGPWESVTELREHNRQVAEANDAL